MMIENTLNKSAGKALSVKQKVMAENKKPSRTEISEYGEFGLIRHLTESFAPRNHSTVRAVGDDAAVLDMDGKLTLVSTDLLLEGIHFDLSYFPLKHLGYKAVAVNISDICAMNGVARQVTVSLGISNRFSVEALETFYAGVKQACDEYGVDLVGGDTSSSVQGMVISVTAIGEVDKDRVVYRSGARVGDLVCVTGYLGDAYVGLQILEREKRIFQEHPDVQPELKGNELFLERFFHPVIRTETIQLFADAHVVPTAMIDLSDGLASDLMHIGKASGVGAYIEEAGVPIRTETQLKIIEEFRMDPITVALHGGEDYELLFTVSPKDLDKVKLLPNLFIAGEITPAADGFKLHTKGGNIHDLKAQGWRHF